MTYTILIVDDDAGVRTILTTIFTTAGFNVVVASNGVDAIKAMETSPCDVVITDIIMPDKEGVETIIELRRRWPDIRVIAISGGGRVDAGEFLELARRFGAHDTLRKPFKRADLLNAVASALTRDQTQKATKVG